MKALRVSARGAMNRILQVAALYAPGAETVRPFLHRARGVSIGRGAFIGTAAIIETSRPHLVSIGDEVSIGIRAVIVAHWREATNERLQRGVQHTVVIEDEVFIGPGSIILPNVRIGRGAVVQAGSVVTTNVPAHTMVQGNPARPVATCSVPLTMGTPLRAFYRGMKPIRSGRA